MLSCIGIDEHGIDIRFGLEHPRHNKRRIYMSPGYIDYENNAHKKFINDASKINVLLFSVDIWCDCGNRFSVSGEMNYSPVDKSDCVCPFCGALYSVPQSKKQ